MKQTEEIQCIRIYGKTRSQEVERIAKEFQLTLYANEKDLTEFLYSPGSEIQLIFGYLLSSGTIQIPDDVHAIEFANDECRVSLSDEIEMWNPPQNEGEVTYEKLMEIRELLTENQVNHHATRGFHGAILYDLSTQQWIVAEDIGRHNAVDKVLGFGLLEGYNLQDSVLLVSGRLISNIVSKGINAGVPIISSITVASFEGINLAINNNRTLMGGLSEKGCWLYHEGPMKVKTAIQ